MAMYPAEFEGPQEECCVHELDIYLVVCRVLILGQQISAQKPKIYLVDVLPRLVSREFLQQSHAAVDERDDKPPYGQATT